MTLMFDNDEIIISNNVVVKKGSSTYIRMVWKMRQEIMAAEDAAIFKILDSIAASGNNDI